MIPKEFKKNLERKSTELEKIDVTFKTLWATTKTSDDIGT